MRLLHKTIVLFSCALVTSAACANDALKQTEFGGVKLGTKATSLGFALDEYEAEYRWQNKFELNGLIRQPGHPIYSITLLCWKGSPSDSLEGIKCGETEASLIRKLGNSIEPMCSSYDQLPWEGQHVPSSYYDRQTNRFWWIDYEKRTVNRFGITLADPKLARCARKFSSEEISKITLGMNVKAALKENYRGSSLGFSYLREDVKVFYNSNETAPRIERVHISCATSADSAPSNEARLACGMNIESLLKSRAALVQYCDPKTTQSKALYRAQSKEYWSVDEAGIVDGFGLWDSPNLTECRKVAVQARLIAETKNRKPNSAPLPLKGEKDIFRIKSISLGDGPSVCSKIETISLTNSRMTLNICFIEEGENFTRVYFDQSKSFVVKVERVVFLNDPDEYLRDALRFYNNELVETETWNYEFGDLNNSRGFRLVKWSCFLFTNGCEGSSAKYRYTFTMVDSGAFYEAADEGRRAYRKKEF